MERPLKKQRSSSVSLGLEDDGSVMSGSASSVSTLQGVAIQSSAFLKTRPSEERAIDTINHMINNPCTSEEVIGMLSLTDTNKSISVATNESNLKLYELQQKECGLLITQVSSELMEKRGALNDSLEEARIIQDKLVNCRNEVHELTNAKDTAQTQMGIWLHQARFSLLLSTLSRKMLETPPAQKPFAKLTLSTIREMMDVDHVDKVYCMSDAKIYRLLWLIFNLGIEANQEFKGLWDSEKNDCDNWNLALGSDPKMLKGKVEGMMMKNRFIDYLDVPGEASKGIGEKIPKNLVLSIGTINEDMEEMSEVEIQAMIEEADEQQKKNDDYKLGLIASLQQKKRAREEEEEE